MAYTSSRTGRTEVYVRSHATPGRAVPVSAAGGANAAWRRDGRELYYWQGKQLVAVSLGEGRAGEPVVRARTPLFQAPYFEGLHGMYDVSPDGTRFALVTGGARASRLVVALGALGNGGVRDGGRR